jgi:hypothetical protein
LEAATNDGFNNIPEVVVTALPKMAEDLSPELCEMFSHHLHEHRTTGAAVPTDPRNVFSKFTRLTAQPCIPEVKEDVGRAIIAHLNPERSKDTDCLDLVCTLLDGLIDEVHRPQGRVEHITKDFFRVMHSLETDPANPGRAHLPDEQPPDQTPTSHF